MVKIISYRKDAFKNTPLRCFHNKKSVIVIVPLDKTPEGVLFHSASNTKPSCYHGMKDRCSRSLHSITASLSRHWIEFSFLPRSMPVYPRWAETHRVKQGSTIQIFHNIQLEMANLKWILLRIGILKTVQFFLKYFLIYDCMITFCPFCACSLQKVLAPIL